MSGLVGLLTMAAFLGLGSFGVGVLPLSFAFSKRTLACLSALGTGLLLGTALGVIIPEGVETIALTSTSRIFPSTTIALSLVAGFAFMLIIEPVIHRISSQTGPTLQHSPIPTLEPSETNETENTVEFDVELGELERAEGLAADDASSTARHKDAIVSASASASVAYPVTLGLIVHALADGFALGSSAVSPVDQNLSLIVFLALLIHKAPTVLALTTSLLATSLPRSECRKHIAVFSASTPIGAVLAYALLSFVRINSEGNWTGVAMLISGGTFLYVATVLQPGKTASEDLSEKTRTSMVVAGMIVPSLIGIIVGHND